MRAKPLSVAYPGLESTDCKQSNNHRPHRWCRPSRRKKSPVAGPSSALLAILATIVSSDSACASPTPPPFLCPSVQPQVPTFSKRAPSHTTDPVPDPLSHHAPRSIPDRYEKDEDGVWRRLNSYTLYGSTVSTCTEPPCLPTNPASSVDDNIQVPNNNSTAPAPSSTSLDIEDTLPPGWKPLVKAGQGRTTLILALSLLLAFFICFFIIGCLFWRKHVKKHYKENDLEGRAKGHRRIRAPSVEETRESPSDKETKAKQKVWARATARWKASVRFSARQRRGKRNSSRMSQANLSSVSLDNSRSRLEMPSGSRNSSRRSSIVSIPDQLSNHDVPGPSTSNLVPDSRTNIPTLPPAYHHRHSIPPIIVSSAGSSVGKNSGASSPFTDRSRRPSHSSINASSLREGDTQPPILHIAHVATDDKSLLARLADLASAPPEDDAAVPTESSAPHAPVWDEEELTDLEVSFTSTTEPPPEPCNPAFPAPPSKEQMAIPDFYNYSFSFEDMAPFDPEPSAPPFEEASVPSLNELLPSAPPPMDEDDLEYFPDSHPNAPEWDHPSSTFGFGEENAPGQGHDRIALEQLPSGPSISVPSSIAHPSPPADHLTHDGITLPGYQP